MKKVAPHAFVYFWSYNEQQINYVWKLTCGEKNDKITECIKINSKKHVNSSCNSIPFNYLERIYPSWLIIASFFRTTVHNSEFDFTKMVAEHHRKITAKVSIYHSSESHVQCSAITWKINNSSIYKFSTSLKWGNCGHLF